MTDDAIEPERFRRQIDLLLRPFDLGPFELLIVDSVQAWARNVGITEKDSERMAMALRRSDGHAIIVLRQHITPDMQAGVKDALLFYGFADQEIRTLDSPASFLEHLVLHEAAHLVLDNPSESDCDRWAFDHLAGW